MRSTLQLVYTSIIVAIVSCGPSIEVRTMAARDRGLSGLLTFRILPIPTRRDGRPPTGADDPVISNSIANRAIREHIERAFLGPGYLIAEWSPDFAVAFYATDDD